MNAEEAGAELHREPKTALRYARVAAVLRRQALKSGIKSPPMYLLLGVFALLFAGAGLILTALGGRLAAARALRVPSVRWFGIGDGYAAVSLGRRLAIASSAPLAAYLFPSALFFSTLWAAGSVEATRTVHALPDSPAASAGVRDGDEIIAVDNVPVATWEELRQRIQRSSAPKVELTIRRNNQNLQLGVVPDAARRVGIQPRSKPVDVSAGSALKQALVLPSRVVTGAVAGFSSANRASEVKVLGPVGISREASKAAKTGSASFVWIVATLASYFWLGTLGIFISSLMRGSARMPRRQQNPL